VHPCGAAVGLPLARPLVDGPGGREVGGQRPPHRPVVGELADRAHDVAHAVAGGPPPRPASQAGAGSNGSQTAIPRRSCPRGSSEPGAAGDPARAAPARHHLCPGRGWVDITIGGRVGPHARLLVLRWIRHPSDYQGPLTSDQRHAAPVSGHLDLPSDGREASAMATTKSDQVHW
jgi:hypothetical protein